MAHVWQYPPPRDLAPLTPQCDRFVISALHPSPTKKYSFFRYPPLVLSILRVVDKWLPTMLAFTPSVETQTLAYRDSQTARCKQTVATNQNYKRMRVAAVKREKNFFSQWLMILTLLLMTGKVARISEEWKVKAKNCKRFVVSSGNCTLKSYPYHFFTISGIVLRRADVWYGHVCERPIY